MAQSDIQSILQQATGMQTTGQSWLPSGVNNGNPNTVYNVTPPEGGYIPPTTDGFGNWMINKPVQSQVTDWSKMVRDPGTVADPYKPVWDLSTSVPQWGGTPTAPPPATNPTPAQPAPVPQAPIQVSLPNQWFGSGKKDGGKSGPLSNQELVKNNPAAKQAWDTVFGFHNGKFDKTSDWAAVQRHLEDEYRKAVAAGVPQTLNPNSATAMVGGGSNAVGGSTGGTGGGGKTTSFLGVGSSPSASQGPVRGTGSSAFTGNAGGGSTLQGLQVLPDNIQQKLGVAADGSIQWQQLADFLLPGNAYLSQTGEWDASNVIANLLGQFTGLPIDSLMTKLGEIQAQQDDPQNWFEKMLIDHYMDKNQNSLAGKMNVSRQEFMANIAPAMSQALANAIDMSNIQMQDQSLQSLLDRAEAKMQEKLNQKSQQTTTTRGGGGERGGARGGNNPGNNLSGVNVQVRSGSGSIRAPRGPGTVTVGDQVKITSSK